MKTKDNAIIAKYIIGVLAQEIKWCKENRGSKNDEYEDGFIRGLRQAIYIIKKILL